MTMDAKPRPKGVGFMLRESTERELRDLIGSIARSTVTSADIIGVVTAITRLLESATACPLRGKPLQRRADLVAEPEYERGLETAAAFLDKKEGKNFLGYRPLAAGIRALRSEDGAVRSGKPEAGTSK